MGLQLARSPPLTRRARSTRREPENRGLTRGGRRGGWALWALAYPWFDVSDNTSQVTSGALMDPGVSGVVAPRALSTRGARSPHSPSTRSLRSTWPVVSPLPSSRRGSCSSAPARASAEVAGLVPEAATAEVPASGRLSGAQAGSSSWPSVASPSTRPSSTVRTTGSSPLPRGGRPDEVEGDSPQSLTIARSLPPLAALPAPYSRWWSPRNQVHALERCHRGGVQRGNPHRCASPPPSPPLHHFRKQPDP